MIEWRRSLGIQTSFAYVYSLTDTGEDSRLVNRRKRPKVDTLFSSLFSEASERRVWLSAESKILASTFRLFRLYRLSFANVYLWLSQDEFSKKIVIPFLWARPEHLILISNLSFKKIFEVQSERKGSRFFLQVILSLWITEQWEL